MTTFFVSDLHLPRRRDRPPALEPGDLVFLEQKFDALCVALDHFVLIGEHLWPIDRGAFALQAHLGEVVFGLMQGVGRMQQRFGRNAADIETGTAQSLAALDHGGFQAELGAADGTDIAAGATTDDDYVKACHGSVPFVSSEPGGWLPPGPPEDIFEQMKGSDEAGHDHRIGCEEAYRPDRRTPRAPAKGVGGDIEEAGNKIGIGAGCRERGGLV